MEDKDLLKEYIIPGKMDKAPEGFTQRVMTRILLENAATEGKTKWKKLGVPLTAVFISLILLSLTAVFYSQPDTSYLSGITNIIDGFNQKILVTGSKLLTDFNIPVILIYTSVGIFLLSVFDFGLQRVLNRKV